MQRKRIVRERVVYVLDYMREGNPLDKHKFHRDKPLIQAVGEDYFLLLELTPLSYNLDFLPEDKIELDSNSSVKVDAHISYEDLTSVSRDNLPKILYKIVFEKEKVFVEIFNKAEPLTLRLHALELLPNIGKKTLRIILEERKKKPFESFKDIESRIGVKDVASILVERIIKEMQGGEKYYLFVYPLIPDENKRLEQQFIYVGYIEKLK
ncbi:DUF655 domain-containing protein [Saccharolobus solfataricus]|uniref:DUF655 domain-containing protein n=3 Tax=Saccharolobus solfataricus TaxID=2287 RepID=Q7LXK5_SACS2|nr:DUF655 domain-containing protein [Saccharolobus solfataricus]AAK41045.1 Conserved hypothetical protein [Saccharolobus solfataricus P2]AKA74072.1 DUF655 domain-containing protein [Saccharolobus solfataricus]AKA76769.1 DUF655 domain-containing protein [Saccharolobus solfataricus]AKA79463.1 DUF655 domain-containing protein [Saccharolobus solfataricus]AZF68551.1 DUF655 domain-containing protein [Saccharolobus solfataricus]